MVPILYPCVTLQETCSPVLCPIILHSLCCSPNTIPRHYTLKIPTSLHYAPVLYSDNPAGLCTHVFYIHYPVLPVLYCSLILNTDNLALPIPQLEHTYIPCTTLQSCALIQLTVSTWTVDPAQGFLGLGRCSGTAPLLFYFQCTYFIYIQCHQCQVTLANTELK